MGMSKRSVCAMQFISQQTKCLWFSLWKRLNYDTKETYTKERAAGDGHGGLDRSNQRVKGKHLDVLLSGSTWAWDSMRKFREERERNKKYFGDQWSDTVEYCGRMISKRNTSAMQG